MHFVKSIESNNNHVYQPTLHSYQSCIHPYNYSFPYLSQAQSLTLSTYPFAASWDLKFNQLYSETIMSLHSNLSMIAVINKKIQLSQSLLDQTTQFLIQQDKKMDIIAQKIVENQNNKNKSLFSQNRLINKIFGNKDYRYRLKLKNKLPQIIYKGRLFNIQVTLLDSRGNQVINNNIINLYVCACDYNAKIILNEDQSSFIQGKTQTQLIRGEAQFLKLYASDITRYFPRQQFSIIIYARPSLINNNIANGQSDKMGLKNINYEQIMPLGVDKITVMAKKKKQNDDQYKR